MAFSLSTMSTSLSHRVRSTGWAARTALESPRRPVRIAIAAAEFNRFITDQLLEGASRALEAHGVAPDDLILAWVPGAYELPLAADHTLAAG